MCFHGDAFVVTMNDLKNFDIHGSESVTYVDGNAKMNEFQVAMGIHHLTEEIAKSKTVVERYNERLSGIEGIRISCPQNDVGLNYTNYPVIFDGFKKTRDEVFEELGKE